MTTPPRLSVVVRRSAPAWLLGVLLLGGGCSFFRNAGSGTHLDAPQDKAPHQGTAKASTMQFEVTTDATGQVVAIRVVRGSGSDAVDNFVADSIRRNWPGGPSTRSLVEIDYRPGTGFSDPKLLSAGPAA